MYKNVSAGFIEMINSNRGVLTSSLVLDDELGTIIDSKDIYSIHYEGASCESKVVPGGFILPKFELSVSSEVVFPDAVTGKKIRWELGASADGSSFENVPVCSAEVTNIKRSGELYKISTQSSFVAKIDKVFSSFLPYPTSVYNVISELEIYHGIKISIENLPNFTIKEKPVDFTVREFISSVAEIAGLFVTVDRYDSELSFHWFTDAQTAINPDCCGDMELSETEFCYNGIACNLNGEIMTQGKSPYLYIQNALGLISEKSELDHISDCISNFSFRSGKIPLILGNILYDVWDILTLQVGDNTYKIPACSIIHDYDGGLTSEIIVPESSDTDPERESSVSRIVNRIVQKVLDGVKSEIQKDIEQAVRDATEAIRGGADGFFHIITDENGVNKETIWCDNIEPLKATYGIRINKAGIGFWSKALDPENTIFTGEYTNAWTIDGSLIADFIRVGTLRGIRIECDNGLIAGWTISTNSIVSPDGSLMLESTYVEPLTTYGYLKSKGYTYKGLHEMTYDQVKYLLSAIRGTSQITSTSGTSRLVIKTAETQYYSNNVLRTKQNIKGQHFYDEDGKYLGFVGTNHMAKDSSKKGITFDLDTDGYYMCWAVRLNPKDSSYTQMLSWDRDEGFRFSDSVIISGDDFEIHNGNVANIYRSIDMHWWDINNVDINVTSDARLKENIQPSEVNALDIVNAMEAVSFDWTDGSGHSELDFLSQQLFEVCPDIVGNAVKNGEDIMTVRMLRVVPYLVKAVQELSAKADMQQKVIDQMCKQFDVAVPTVMSEKKKTTDYDRYKRFIKMPSKGEKKIEDHK